MPSQFYKGYEIRRERLDGRGCWVVYGEKRIPPRPLARFNNLQLLIEWIDERTKNEPWSSMLEEFTPAFDGRRKKP
jgi:hypothetical protein